MIRMSEFRSIAVAMIVVCCLLCAPSASAVTECVSAGFDGLPAAGMSLAGNMSGGGRYVVFASDAANLVPGDTNGTTDTFVFDRTTGVTERVSVAWNGAQSNGPSCGWSPKDSGVYETPCISADGRYVVFASTATNLVSGVTSGQRHIYRRDRTGGTTEIVSVSGAGVPGNGVSYYPSISADGQRIAFCSDASNLIGGDTNGTPDVFVRDMSASTTQRVNLSSTGEQAVGEEVHSDMTASISGDGGHVAFVTRATNMVPGHNGQYLVYVRDLDSGVTEAVSVSNTGQLSDGFCWGHGHYIDYDGSVVTFSSFADNLTPGDTYDSNDVFVRDRTAGATTCISRRPDGGVPNAQSSDPTISADGNTIVFDSEATDILPGADGVLDCYLYDREAGTTERVGIASTGGALPGWDVLGVVSPDGRFVSFTSIPDPESFSDARVMVLDRSAITVSQAKRKADTDDVIVGAGVVSAVFDGDFYFQQDGISSPRRASGIRVVSPQTVSLGKRYVIGGEMATDTEGERYIAADSVLPHTSTWTVDVAPIGLTNRALGGVDWLYEASTGAGQMGVAGGVGLNNIGLLVKTWGRITAFDPDDPVKWFVIDDGSAGGVRCEVYAGIAVSREWEAVEVTGISSILGGERLVRVVTATVPDSGTAIPAGE